MNAQEIGRPAAAGDDLTPELDILRVEEVNTIRAAAMSTWLR